MKTLKKKHNGKRYKGGARNPQSSVRSYMPGATSNRVTPQVTLRTNPSLSSLRTNPSSRVSSFLPGPNRSGSVGRNGRTLPPRQPPGRNGRPPPPPGSRNTGVIDRAPPNRPGNTAQPNRQEVINPNRSDIITDRFRSNQQIMSNRHTRETTGMNNRHANESDNLKSRHEQELEGVTDPATRRTIDNRQRQETDDMNNRHANEAETLNRRQGNERGDLDAQGNRASERVGSSSDIITNRFRSTEQNMTNRHANESTSMNNRHMNESNDLRRKHEQELEGVTDPAARKTIQDKHARETADMNRRHDNEANVLNKRQGDERANLEGQRNRAAQASGQPNGSYAQGLQGLGMAGLMAPNTLMPSQYPGPGAPGAPGAYSGDGDGSGSGSGSGNYGSSNYYGNQGGPGGNGNNNFVDNNGDGLDDNTGLPYEEFMELYGDEFLDEFIDEDGDGFDDNTGLSYDEFIAMQSDRLRNNGEGSNSFSLSSRSSRRIRGEILPGVPMEIEPEEYNGPKVPFQYGNIYKDAKTGFLTTQFMTRTGKGSKFYSIYGSSITEIDQAIKGFQVFSIKRDSPHGDFVEAIEDLVDKLESNIKRSQSDADRLMQSFEDLEPIHRNINVKYLDLVDARTKVLIEQLAAAKSLQAQGIR